MSRKEKDSFGTLELPEDALYGASTARAMENFSVSGYRMPVPVLRSVALIKKVAAQIHGELHVIPEEKSKLIQMAADEIYRGDCFDAFPVDVFQTGSATSTHMNVNEVIANRANQLAGYPLGDKSFIHPNDDVNKGQSSNDVMPTALHISLAYETMNTFQPALVQLRDTLREKSKAFEKIVKPGRTHLMDATPMTLGQEFSGFAAQIDAAIERCDRMVQIFKPLAIGGTAVGTGAFTHQELASRVCEQIKDELGIEFVEAPNHFCAQGSRDESVEAAGIVSAIAVALEKIANDIRLLASGPRCGFGELKLPALQPGSSIMPGKVNPVICEMVVQVSMYVRGLCSTVTSCGASGYLQLNTTIPLIAYALHESIRLLSHAIRNFSQNCIAGIEAHEERCHELVERSLMIATNLSAIIGYDKTAAIAKRAEQEGKSLREILKEEAILNEDQINEALDVRSML